MGAQATLPLLPREVEWYSGLLSHDSASLLTSPLPTFFVPPLAWPPFDYPTAVLTDRCRTVPLSVLSVGLPSNFLGRVWLGWSSLANRASTRKVSVWIISSAACFPPVWPVDRYLWPSCWSLVEWVVAENVRSRDKTSEICEALCGQMVRKVTLGV